MRVLHVVETDEFGDDFEFVDGKWKVRFPPQTEPKYKLSADENNTVVLDVDETIHLDKTKLYAYIMVQDDEQAKVFLYRYPAGTEFDRTTATEVGAADMVEINALVDDIAITDAIIEFSDVHSGNALVFDTNQFQRTGTLYAERGLTLESVQNGEPSVELDVTLHCSESGGGLIIKDNSNENTALTLWGYYYNSGPLADLATSNLNSDYSGKLEFYDVGEPTQMLDGIFAMRGSIGIRNISAQTLDLLITVYDSENWNGVSTIHSVLGNNTSAYRLIDGVHTVTVTLAPGESTTNVVKAFISELPYNILQTRELGLYVDPNSLNGSPTIPQSLEAIEVMDAPVNEGMVHDTLLHRIGDSHPPLEIPLITLVNNRGVVLGSVVKALDGKISNEPR